MKNKKKKIKYEHCWLCLGTGNRPCKFNGKPSSPICCEACGGSGSSSYN